MMQGGWNHWRRLARVAVLFCLGTGALAELTNAPVAPSVPLLPSPVTVLRELLAVPAAKRAELLVLYPEELRGPLEAKVKEYATMPSDLRELRLQATDLRHYLMQLLPLDAPARTAALAQVPGPIRPAVGERLETWQLLLPEMQAEFLENEQVVRHFTQIGITSEEQRKELLDITLPVESARMEAKIASWQALPEETRRRVFAQFNQMFDLTAEERQKVLGTLPDEEREAMSSTLAVFSGLSPEKRMVCMRSFEKFSHMGLMERREFLKKAEAWERMTPSERGQWREVVSRVKELPPLPPGLIPRVKVTTPAPSIDGG